MLLLMTAALAAPRLEGTPEVPPELAEELRPWLEPRSAYLNDLAPDGLSMLVTTRFGETTQVHLVEQPLGARQQLTFRAEPSGGARFLDEGLLFRSDEGGDEKHQIFRLGSDGVERVTDGDSRHGSALVDPSGQWLATSSNFRNGKDTDVTLMRVDGSERRALTQEEGSWYPLEWSPDGQSLLVRRYRSVVDSELYVVQLDGQKRALSDRPGSYRAAVFGEDEHTLYVTTDRDSEFTELYRVDLSKRRPRWIPLTEHIDWNVEDLEWTQRGLAFTVNEEGYTFLHLLEGDDERRFEGLPMGIIEGLDAAEEAPILGFTASGPTRTADAWTLDLDSGELTRWTESELGGLDPSRFVEPELIRTPSFDGLEVPAFVYRPPGEGPHPVLISIHGGPEAQARPRYRGLYQYLALEKGVAIVVPNVRGSNGYGKSYVQMDDGFQREDSVKDIGAILDWVEAQEDLDSERVMVRGGSYGGYMVLASLIHHGDRLVGGCDSVGISNFVTFLENTGVYRVDLRRAEYGDERDPEMRAFLEQISPTTRAAEIDRALFVVHGANDPRVPVGEAEQIVEAVRANGEEAWLMVAPDEGHGFKKKGNRDLYTQLFVLFLEQQLLSEG